jgi:hypothetical protein
MLLIFTGISMFTMYKHFKTIRTKAEPQEIWLKIRISVSFVVVGALMYLFDPSFYSYSLIYVVSFNLSKITIISQLSHITSREFEPFRCSTFTLLLLLVGMLLMSVFITNVWLYIYGLLLLTILEFSGFVVVVVSRLADLLGIRVFSVSPKSCPPATNMTEGQTRPGPENLGAEGENFKKVANANDSMPDDTQEGGI